MYRSPSAEIEKLEFLSRWKAARAAAGHAADIERRACTRRLAAELPWLKHVRLKYGPTVSLIDFSSGGAQIETTSTLRPGSSIVVEIDAKGTELAVPSQVLRCQVSAIRPYATYRGALAFRRALDLPLVFEMSDASATASPKHEHARLALALKRLGYGRSDSPGLVGAVVSGGSGPSSVGEAALAAAAMMIDTPAARRAGPAFARELSNLFREITRGIEQGESPNLLLGRLRDLLCRVLPARDIRMTDLLGTDRAGGPEAVYFDVPSASVTAARLLVEFPPKWVPLEWQFQLLKAGAHLATAIRELGGSRSPEAPSEIALEQPPDSPAGPAWAKVVVRYADGRLLKGHTMDFLASRGQFHVSSSIDNASEAQVAVPVGHLKAVFFVRDFVGASDYDEQKTFAGPAQGRKIAITFLDDELLVGTTLSYRPDALGFFVSPVDPKSNNLRIFVVWQAIRHVQYI